MEVKSEIISQLIGIRPSVLEFALLMEEKLKQNDSKGGWSKCDFPYLVERLKEETKEMEQAIDEVMMFNKYRSHPRIMKVKYEAADLANFAMMIADNIEKIDKH